MGPSTESLALADYLISKLGLQVDRISLAYAIMDHVEVEYAVELAQPSPGGQRATSHVVSRMVSTAPEKIFLQVGDGDYSDEPFPNPVGEEVTWCSDSIVESEVAYVRADLAARQPAGISAEWVLGYLTTDAPEESREAIRNAFTEYAALSGARQPAGEPVGWYTDDHLADRSATTYDRTVADRWRAKGWPVSPLYAAPPAQAVDLGQFRDLAEFALSNAKLHNCWEKREALARELLALIDGKAVGK